MADIHRLEAAAPEIFQGLAYLSPEELRAVGAASARLAVATSGLDDATVEVGLEALSQGRFGDDATLERLTALVERLDETQWDLQDRVEVGAATEEEHVRAFSQARAANSLLCALEKDPREATTEAVYESLIATDDRGAIAEIVRRHGR